MTLLNRRIYEQNDEGLFIFKCIEPMTNRDTVLDTVALTNVVKPKYRYSNVDAEWTKITSDVPTPTTSVISDLDALFENLKIVENNSFVNQMAFKYAKFGSLTEKQINVLTSIFRNEVAQKARAKNQAPSLTVDKIKELFEVPKSNGLKYPKFTVGDITLSLPTENSDPRNKDAIYVKHDGVYVGKIDGGKFQPTSRCDTSVGDKLLEIAKDPRGEAIGHGHMHGNCSMCRKKLSDPRSMKIGMGEICSNNWGFNWGEK